MADPKALRKRLDACPLGQQGWKEFEEVCTDILTYLFVPPLELPKTQARTYSGIDRRDAVFPNRKIDGATNWGHLFRELDARLVLVEFKNYDGMEVGKDEANQTRNYLTKPMGRLAMMCCRTPPNDAAHIKRNTIYSEEKKVILFLSPENLKEMLFMKERGDDPSDFIMDLVELFYIQHE
jgi:hypothetical protein